MRWVQAKKKVVKLAKSRVASSTCFLKEDFYETVTPGKKMPDYRNVKLQWREHNYKTGSKYKGEWKGCFRHGKGT